MHHDLEPTGLRPYTYADETRDLLAEQMQADKEAAVSKWLRAPKNMLELQGWHTDGDYAELARLDALISYELSRPYTGEFIRDIETGIREYTEQKDKIYQACALRNFDELGITVGADDEF
jgi:hypothetical protein